MQKILIIAGPTASGKTDIALDIAKRVNGEIISCDSMQVYKGMPIVTQAPKKTVYTRLKGRLRMITTHLVSFLDLSKEYSASDFRLSANRLIEQIIKKGKLPIIAGGTGLYIRALLDGLFEPEGEGQRDEALRAHLKAEQEAKGGVYLHDVLSKIDPTSAAKIHANDHRRLIRAIEVYYTTGKPHSEQKDNRQGIRNSYDCHFIFLDRDREDLYERVERRVDVMMQKGLAKEVKKISQKKLSKTASVAIGIREVQSYLKKEISLEEAVRLIKQRTRNYAKRQISWFRHEKGVQWVKVDKNDHVDVISERILRLTGIETSP